MKPKTKQIKAARAAIAQLESVIEERLRVLTALRMAVHDAMGYHKAAIADAKVKLRVYKRMLTKLTLADKYGLKL